MKETEIVGPLVGQSRTIDQARAVLTFSEAIADKTLRSTVALTAGRGRGKSAAMGLAIAAAVGFGYAPYTYANCVLVSTAEGSY